MRGIEEGGWKKKNGKGRVGQRKLKNTKTRSGRVKVEIRTENRIERTN